MEISRGSQDFQTGSVIPFHHDGEAAKSSQRAPATGLAASLAPALAHITERMSRSGDLALMLEEVLVVIAGMCGTGMGSLFLSRGSGELDMIASTGLPPRLRRELKHLASDGPLGRYVSRLEKAGVYFTSHSGSHPSSIHYLAASEGLGTVVTVPLTYAGERCGSIFLYHSTERNYSSEDLKVLDSLATLIAVNIGHARLLDTRVWERKAQDQFLDVLSHELRTPLTTILGFTQMLRRRFSESRAGDNRAEEQLTIIWAQAQRLNRLLDTFMDMSSLERGEFEIEYRRLEVASLLKSSLEQIQAQARRSHRVELALPSEPVWIFGDARRLEHIFSHIISNAFRYSPLEKSIAVECRKVPDLGLVTVAVTDRGPGIPADVQGEIFKRFYPTDARKTGGMGIGLYMSRAIAEAHGGKLTLGSSPGVGTTVTIALPL